MVTVKSSQPLITSPEIRSCQQARKTCNRAWRSARIHGGDVERAEAQRARQIPIRLYTNIW